MSTPSPADFGTFGINDSPQRVLVVDDSPDNLRVVGEMLAPRYEVRIANNGRRGLELALQQPAPDLILLDIMMPELDGYGVLERLRASPATSAIPVIFLTAMDSPDDEELGLRLGAVDYITKPLQPTVLLARVNTQLELKRARDLMQAQNTWLEAEVARRMTENQLIQDVSILALARLAETRDNDTGHHLRRTQQYMLVLGRQLQRLPHYGSLITEHYLQLLTKSAPLHDIGKVGIPDSILQKPGSLTAAEWAIMKTHAVLGARAIEQAEQDANQPVEFLRLAKEIAHWHHERWDGEGYPDSLAGEDIPLSARLMALADVFDALISKRVYKQAMALEEARDIIVRGSGRHFDPEVVDAFVATFDQFAAIAMRYRDEPDGAQGSGDQAGPVLS